VSEVPEVPDGTWQARVGVADEEQQRQGEGDGEQQPLGDVEAGADPRLTGFQGGRAQGFAT